MKNLYEQLKKNKLNNVESEELQNFRKLEDMFKDINSDELQKLVDFGKPVGKEIYWE